MNPAVRTTVLTLAAALSLAACGGGSSGGGTPDDSLSPAAGSRSTAPADTATEPADPAAAKADITAVWEKFFHTGTARSEAADLLEDGDNLDAALDKAEQEDKANNLVRRAKVQLISFLTPTTANITYTLLNGSTPLLDNASGQAVFLDGKWKVSKLTFCTLVELGNDQKPVRGCSP